MIVRGSTSRAVLAAIAVLTAYPAPARASPGQRLDPIDEARIATCIRASSGGRHWLEQTLWGLRDQEGGWVGAEVANQDGSHDLGPLQVNSWWVAKLATITGRRPTLVRWWLIHDACFNVEAARWIFLSALSATGDYWRAVGVYHSPTNWRARRYAGSVAAHLRRRFGTGAFAKETRTGASAAAATSRSVEGELQ